MYLDTKSTTKWWTNDGKVATHVDVSQSHVLQINKKIKFSRCPFKMLLSKRSCLMCSWNATGVAFNVQRFKSLFVILVFRLCQLVTLPVRELGRILSLLRKGKHLSNAGKEVEISRCVNLGPKKSLGHFHSSGYEK